MDTLPHINHKLLSVSHQILHLTLHISFQPWWTGQLSIKETCLIFKSFLLFISSVIFRQQLFNTRLVSPSMEAAPYTSNKPHPKNRWYTQTHTALQINDNSERHHGASTWEGISPLHTEGGLVVFPLSRADFPMKCFHFAPFGFSCSTGYN